MRRILVAISMTLPGCVSSVETRTQDGSIGHVVSCPSPGGLIGSMTDWGSCFAKAGELCGSRGYQVLHKSGETGFDVAVTQYGGHASTTASRSLIIRCNAAVAKSKG